MTSATNKDDVLSDSQLDTVVGGHKSGPSNYNKKNATLPLPAEHELDAVTGGAALGR
jgi:hypothetical protein